MGNSLLAATRGEGLQGEDTLSNAAHIPQQAIAGCVTGGGGGEKRGVVIPEEGGGENSLFPRFFRSSPFVA